MKPSLLTPLRRRSTRDRIHHLLQLVVGCIAELRDRRLLSIPFSQAAYIGVAFLAGFCLAFAARGPTV